MNRPGRSGYFGVYWHEGAKKWAAQIRIEKEIIYLGLFKDKLEAARAFDKKSFSLRKTEANLNFPEDFKHEKSARKAREKNPNQRAAKTSRGAETKTRLRPSHS